MPANEDDPTGHDGELLGTFAAIGIAGTINAAIGGYFGYKAAAPGHALQGTLDGAIRGFLSGSFTVLLSLESAGVGIPVANALGSLFSNAIVDFIGVEFLGENKSYTDLLVNDIIQPVVAGLGAAVVAKLTVGHWDLGPLFSKWNQELVEAAQIAKAPFEFPDLKFPQSVQESALNAAIEKMTTINSQYTKELVYNLAVTTTSTFAITQIALLPLEVYQFVEKARTIINKYEQAVQARFR